MPSNSLLHFITKIVNFEGFKATNYYFITAQELIIELENKGQLFLIIFRLITANHPNILRILLVF